MTLDIQQYISAEGTIKSKKLSKYDSQGSVTIELFNKHGLPEVISKQLALAYNTKSNYETIKRNIKRFHAYFKVSNILY